MGKSQTLTPAERQHLADLYDALVGAASENGTDFFDGYHKRGGAAMLNELETLLQKYAPVELASVAG